jgi:Trk K+ transport system NAD-binding subunit
VSWVARRLRLSAQAEPGGTVDPLDLVAAGDRDIVEFRVNAGSQAAGRRLLDLGVPHGALVVLIQRASGRSAANSCPSVSACAAHGRL